MEIQMKLSRFFLRALKNSGESESTNEQAKQEYSELITNMRSVSRKANGQVSAPMDAAIIAGGVIGGNVKAIQTKTHELYNQISTASSAVKQITGNIHHFEGYAKWP
jgi:hypothetical protein